jgi:hypothetical protein
MSIVASVVLTPPDRTPVKNMYNIDSDYGANQVIIYD